ncbi:MAG: hypothetical protein ACYDCH_07820 [Gaiellaceae bacterium]
MLDYDETLARALDELLSRGDHRPDWGGVLRDAQRGWGRIISPRSPRRRLATLAAGAAIALLIPLTSLAVGEHWWFFSSPIAAPTPVGDVVVVRSGVLEGTPWVLTAYRTSDQGLCVAFAPNASTSEPESTPTTNSSSTVLSCGASVSGLPHADAQPGGPHELGFVESASTGGEMIGGPTAADVAQVKIVRTAGSPLTVDTFAAPAALDAPLHFFVAELGAGDTVQAVQALDNSGQVLETLTISTP